ncbi:hypothetical protein SFR_2572 [Streptomyces sp. FR-008]|nr:hypothetical protein SFR_2572 [Streptomyces sp. FR-008]
MFPVGVTTPPRTGAPAPGQRRARGGRRPRRARTRTDFPS